MIFGFTWAGEPVQMEGPWARTKGGKFGPTREAMAWAVAFEVTDEGVVIHKNALPWHLRAESLRSDAVVVEHCKFRSVTRRELDEYSRVCAGRRSDERLV